MRYDKQQSILSGTGIKPNPHNYAKIKITYSILDERKVFCPFCLINLPLNNFLITVKKGIHQSLGKCPNCENEILLKTLDNLNVMTMKEFAKFIFDYRLNGFWDKAPFEQFKSRLKEFEDYQDFWDEYKRLKEQ